MTQRGEEELYSRHISSGVREIDFNQLCSQFPSCKALVKSDINGQTNDPCSESNIREIFFEPEKCEPMSTNLDISPPKRPCPLSDLNTIDYSSSNANNSVLSASYLTDQSSSIASSTLINCSLAHHSSLNAVDQKHWFGCIVAASLKINSGYWPSLIIDPEWCNLQKPKSGTIWVYWYGTNQISQINTKNRLRSYSEIFSSSEYHKKTKSIQRAMNKAYLDLMYRNYLVVDDCCDFEAAEQQLQQTTDLLSNQNADDCLQMACLHSLEEKLGDSKSALTDLLSSQDFIKRSMVSRATLLILKKLRTNFFYKAKSFSNPDSHVALNGTSMSNNCNLIGSNSSSMLIKAATDATNSLSNQSSQTSEEEMAELIRRGNSEYPINVKNHQDWLNGKLALRDVCLACWNTSVECEHPFFVGGLCQQCKDFFMESVFMISDEDGCYFYCSVCGNGGNLYVCTNDACKRVYCSSCMQTFYSDEEIKAILADDYWHCELCRETIAEETLRARSSLPMVVSKTLCMRDNWQKLLANMFLPQTYTEISFKDGMPKRELRVLSLFDGIGTGLVALDKLNIRIDKYFASEIHVDAINICKMNHGSRVTHIGDIKNIDMPKLKSLLPIDLVIGGSPCNDFSAVNPARKGIYDFNGTGPLFFEYYRVLQMVRILQPDLNVFWLYENVSSMNKETKQVINRFLECDPALWDAVNFSPQHRARYMWGNIPGMHNPPSDYHTMVGLSLSLDEILIKNLDRKAKVMKVRTITTMTNSLYSNSRSKDLPVKMGESDSSIWITELEQIFGFLPHYTDIGYLSPNGRLKVLGVSWSVNVIKHLLQPLKEFFVTNSSPVCSS